MFKNLKKRNKRILLYSSFIVLSSIVATSIITNKKNINSKASSIPYYSTYKDIVKIEDHAAYTPAQGMSITSGKAFYAKINKNTNTTRIWMYNLAKQKKYLVYNGNSSKTDFNMGHANSLYADSKYLYVATMNANKDAIQRYNINYSNGKYYLSNKKSYYIYSASSKLLAISGIEYSTYLKNFIVKNGTHIFVGNFKDNEFKWTKHYTISTNFTVKGKTSTKKIDLSQYTHQGMYCRGKTLYLPFVKKDAMNQSIIVTYILDNNLSNNSVLKANPSPYFQITSQKYKRLFEIEEIGYYNGEMYANVNATYTEGGNNDRIIKINNFKF
jgi:hypothetical protein